MRLRKMVPGLLVLLVLRPASVLAEFTVGSQIAAFSLSTPNGKTVSVEQVGGELQVVRDGRTEKPKVLAIHLLQPDCLQCRAQLKPLQALHQRFEKDGLVVLGVAHRGDAGALAGLGRDLDVTFPLLVGADSALAKEFAAGDTFGLIDSKGVVRFAQVGYGVGDEVIWAENVEAMLDGRAPVKESVDRERLQVGDPFPAVVLPSLRSGKTLELVGKEGKLVFRGEDGRETRPKAAVGFFSRY